jgi:hypothetical protein
MMAARPTPPDDATVTGAVTNRLYSVKNGGHGGG